MRFGSDLRKLIRKPCLDCASLYNATAQEVTYQHRGGTRALPEEQSTPAISHFDSK